MTDGPNPDAKSVARARLDAATTGIVAGVERLGASYVLARARVIVEAWDALSQPAVASLDAQLARASTQAARRVADALRDLFETELQRQATTPLAIVRTIVVEPTRALAEAGIPPIERDEFEQRTNPHDQYGMAPRDLGELGDPDLAPLHMIWGLAKAELMRGDTLPGTPRTD